MKLATLNKKFSAFWLLAAFGCVATPAQANDFPTTARVEYVLECMQKHNRDYEYFYKCSCVVDDIAKNVSYNEFSELLTASRYLRLGGERGAEFRDPKAVKKMVRKYKTLETNAGKACFIPEKKKGDDDD